MGGNTNLYVPSISYWSPNGPAVYTPDLSELMSAITSSEVVLLIHGYNNVQQDASDAFHNFMIRLANYGTVSANLVGIYWPGANWEGPLYYMQAICQAKATAQVLAQGLYDLAKAKTYLKINIVTHSLGGRLALEAVKEIIKLRPSGAVDDELVLGKITLMAAAVPTRYLADMAQLQAVWPAFKATQSIYSKQDRVLQWAFPLGQTADGEGFFPVALGRKEWLNGRDLIPQMDQQNNFGANHGDYWGATSKKPNNQDFAADTVYDFMALGANVSRTVDSRSVTGAAALDARSTTDARTLSVRS